MPSLLRESSRRGSLLTCSPSAVSTPFPMLPAPRPTGAQRRGESEVENIHLGPADPRSEADV